MKNLYMIGGTMGVGKTTVCKILKSTLSKSVFLDGDWCWDASPFVVNEETKTMVLDNICHLLNNFLLCTAYNNVIFCWVMHEQSIINNILNRLPVSSCNIKRISLTCQEETLIDRLQKDVLKGERTNDIISRSVARLPLYDKLNTLKIDTTNKTPQMVATEIAAL